MTFNNTQNVINSGSYVERVTAYILQRDACLTSSLQGTGTFGGI